MRTRQFSGRIDDCAGRGARRWFRHPHPRAPLNSELSADPPSQEGIVQPPSTERAPAPAPGRLALLGDLAARLAEAPESPETLQAVVEATLQGTHSARAEVRVAVDGERLVFRAGGHAPRSGRKLSVRVRAGGVPVGDVLAWREAPYHDADRLFMETVASHLGGALDAQRLLRAERQAAAHGPGAELQPRSALGRLRSLFGGAAGRAAPAPEPQRGPRDERRLQALADDLVTLARLQVTTGAIPERVVLAPWLGWLTTRRFQRAQAGDRQIVLVEPDADLSVQAVAAHLETAVEHLISNALAYSPAGSAITVSAERVGSEVRITVEDEGPGVAPAERDRIFERYQRGRAAVAADVPGNGLGLAVVSEVAAAHRGRAWCEPAAGGGSRFTIGLPDA